MNDVFSKSFHVTLHKHETQILESTNFNHDFYRIQWKDGYTTNNIGGCMNISPCSLKKDNVVNASSGWKRGGQEEEEGRGSGGFPVCGSGL